ncbi:MAG: M1 family metallopeptidase [Microbacterium sp.]
MSVDPYIPQSGDARISVESYDLDLEYKLSTNRLSGTASLDVRIVEDTAAFSLDLVGLRVKKVRGAARFTQNDRKVKIALAEPAVAGDLVHITLTYAGAPKPRRTRWGALGWEELEDGLIVASQPTGAATWFPCNDVPADKATYMLRIATDPEYTVVSSVPAARGTERGRAVWTFDIPTPTPTYLMTLQIGQYLQEDVELSGVPTRLFYPREVVRRVHEDFADLERMMGVFQDAFGPYPFAGYTVVVTPDELEIPLEAQAMAIFGANHIDGEHGLERLVAHELAHQWFGNSVGLHRWQDIWLNEGFACYAEWIWSEASGGPSAHAKALAHHRRLAGLDLGTVLADPGPAEMFDDWVYKRGALTVHALRLTIGDDAFFDLLRAWTGRNAHGTVVTSDLLALAEEISGMPLAGLFDAWVHTAALPALPEGPVGEVPAPLTGPILGLDRSRQA